MSREALLEGLSRELPPTIDHLTPEGRLPTEQETMHASKRRSLDRRPEPELSFGPPQPRSEGAKVIGQFFVLFSDPEPTDRCLARQKA
jgi:YidB-like protein